VNDSIANLFDVAGKVAVVTGGSSGIGRMIARGLLTAGAKVFIVARNTAKCEQTVDELARVGDISAIPGDLSSVSGIRNVAAGFARMQNRLDILVSNAGLLEFAPVDDYSEEIWDRAIDLNLKAGFFLTQALLPQLRASATVEDPARVITISSGHGMRISPFDHFGYTASKAGLIHLTRALAQRLAREHITVNSIAPGAFATALTSDFSKELVDRIICGIPLARMGREADIVGAVIYFASRAGSYTTSTVLPVDGGWAGIA
jgi:NAD(P)-dependent dehydrogenase (short-subunit alcohol dehydrogenase family)